MTHTLATDQVWEVIEKELFAVLGMVNARNEARTVGIVYIVEDRKLYIATGRETWKERHIRRNPHVSLTIPIVKRVPLMPWLKIPSATITFCGTARILEPHVAAPHLLQAIFRGSGADPATLEQSILIEVTPKGDFLTYGVGVPLMDMRTPEKARGRAPVA